VRTKLLAFCNIYNNAHEPAGAPINLLQKKKQQLTAPFSKGMNLLFSTGMRKSQAICITLALSKARHFEKSELIRI